MSASRKPFTIAQFSLLRRANGGFFFTQKVKSAMALSMGTPPSRRKSARNPFTPEEDEKLVEVILRTAGCNFTWPQVAEELPGRTPRQCRERWTEYLHPDVRSQEWTDEEDDLLLSAISARGHKWTQISQVMLNRSDNDIKNRWYTHLRHVVRELPDGRLELMRDENGDRIQTKKKRKRKHGMPSQKAFTALAMRNSPDVVHSILPPRMRPAPLACVSDNPFHTLSVEYLLSN
jgi:hypothetical protein